MNSNLKILLGMLKDNSVRILEHAQNQKNAIEALYEELNGDNQGDETEQTVDQTFGVGDEKTKSA